MRYFCHSKIKSISFGNRVISSIYFTIPYYVHVAVLEDARIVVRYSFYLNIVVLVDQEQFLFNESDLKNND